MWGKAQAGRQNVLAETMLAASELDGMKWNGVEERGGDVVGSVCSSHWSSAQREYCCEY